MYKNGNRSACKLIHYVAIFTEAFQSW